MPLTLYKSSAGSGKTYTLARAYVRLALREPDYYKKILAVTFTNRAAEEMKERVLDFFIRIAEGTHELIPTYASELNCPEAKVVASAKECLSHILHHYGQFSITTIDTFFHAVIRSFSREIGLQGSFGIELDSDKVAEYITSAVYQGVESNAQLKAWLTAFSMEGLLDGKGYETKNQVERLARQLFQEEFKQLSQTQFSAENFKETVQGLKQKLFETKRSFEEKLSGIASQFDQVLRNTGLTIDDLNYKSSGPGGFFQKLERKEYASLVTKRVDAARVDAEKWTSKSSPLQHQIVQVAEQHFIPLVNDALDHFSKYEKEYYTAEVVLRHLHTLGLISDLTQKLQEYKQEHEVIMISDLSDFLSQIIDETGSPFIYEKVGTWYSHFLIDEFQDTSQLQWNNFRPLLDESLANGHESIVVGDAKQSIYGWRGGDPSILMEQVQKDLPPPLSREDPTKNTNWRSAKTLVEFNNALFAALPKIMADSMAETIDDRVTEMIRMAYRDVEQLVSPKKEDEEGLVQIEFLDADRLEWKKEAMRRTLEIMEGLLAEGHQLNDMAILVRTNKEAAEIVNQVLDYRRSSDTRIEVISAEGMLLANSAVVQLILSAFYHLIDPNDVSIKADLSYRYQRLVKRKTFTTHEDFSKIVLGGLPGSFTKYKQHLLHLPILELVEVLIRTFELNTLKEEFAYLQAFQDAVLEFTKNNRSDLRLFLSWWEENGAKRSIQLTGAIDAVEVITSHKSKGLQYPIVFVPFCNFDMNSRSKPVWYHSPYEAEMSVPVDYKSELEKTAFVQPYHQEFVKWHLESLNVLYVAFTRAESGLFVFCEPPPKRQEKPYSTASKLLWSFFEGSSLDGWNEGQALFKKGKLLLNHRKGDGEMMELTQYVSNKWSNKLQVRKSGKAYFDDDVEKSREEGILLHQILSEIIHFENATRVLSKYEKAMMITKDDQQKYQALFDALWKDETVRSWFNGVGEVKTEVLVLPKDGEVKRIDRVILDGKKATVIDFKSGNPKGADEKQLREYMHLLRDMGYETEGYLLYLQSRTIKKC